MTPTTDRRGTLSTFLSRVEEEFGWSFNRDEFEDRLLLQKYVFFAQRLGLKTDYDYNVYVFGAYSPDLAQDYYSDEILENNQAIGVDSFPMDDFRKMVRGKGPRWLEIASTLELFLERFDDKPESERKELAIKRTMEEKEATEKTVSNILTQLENSALNI